MSEKAQEGTNVAGTDSMESTNAAEIQNSEVKLEVKMETAPEPKAEEKKAKKISFRKIPLKDFNTWITRPVKDGDLDINGKQIEAKRVFCLKAKDIDDANLPAYPLLYDLDAKDDFGQPLLVAYKKSQIRNSQRGVVFKEGDVVDTTNLYKQHTVMVEQTIEGSELGIGLAGYWKSKLTAEDIVAMEEAAKVKAEAAEKKAKEIAAKKLEKENLAKAKAEALQKAAVATAAEAASAGSEAAPSAEGSEPKPATAAPSKTKKSTEAAK